MDDLLNITEIPPLTPRAPESHKGTFGKILVIAGSPGMSGAAVLSGTAGLRGGAGLVQVGVPASIGQIVATSQPCYTTTWLPTDEAGRLSRSALDPLREMAKAATVVVLGPGLGQSDEIHEVVSALVHELACPLLLDADALNVLGRDPSCLRDRSAPLVLTPHPGEFARLIGSDTGKVQAARRNLAVAFARRHGVFLVLKGAGTIVTDGRRFHVNTTGNPGMATGGTGDVLTGLIGALLAQRIEPFSAAVLGVYLHGRAGDLARDELGEVSLIATDLLDRLPAAILEHTRRQ